MTTLAAEPPLKKIKLEDGAIASSMAELHAVESDSSDAPKKRSDGKKHVEKGSLNLHDLIQAKKRAQLANQTKPEITDDDKKQERRAANRLSAFQSRQRRKLIIEDLRQTVAQLSQENAQQRSRITEMKTQHEEYLKENEFLRSQLVAIRQVAPPPTNLLELLCKPKPAVAPVPAPQPPSNEVARLLQELVSIQARLQKTEQPPVPPQQPAAPPTDLMTLLQALQK